VLSNAIWILPTADRSAAPGTVTIYYRCGSQAGKAALATSSGLSDSEFADLTTEFVAREIEIYRRAKASNQKNAARNLTKYLDQHEISIIERDAGQTLAAELARILL
jgi:hypothetical protein